MSGDEFRSLRVRLGLTQEQAAVVLGYSGRRQTICAMEAGRAPVADQAARLMAAYASGYRPGDWPLTPDAHP